VGNFKKHPDVAEATKVGDPTLVDPKMVSATDVVQQATRAMMPNAGSSGNNTVSVETVKTGAPLPDQPAPRSDDAAPAAGVAVQPTVAAPAPGELQPNVSANDPNELKPNVTDNGGQIPPPQVNEIQAGATDQGTSSSGQTGATGTKTGDQASPSSPQKDDVDAAIASSKHKKKKGLKKIVPF
jgi:hypothetical protein